MELIKYEIKEKYFVGYYSIDYSYADCYACAWIFGYCSGCWNSRLL